MYTSVTITSCLIGLWLSKRRQMGCVVWYGSNTAFQIKILKFFKTFLRFSLTFSLVNQFHLTVEIRFYCIRFLVYFVYSVFAETTVPCRQSGYGVNGLPPLNKNLTCTRTERPILRSFHFTSVLSREPRISQ